METTTQLFHIKRLIRTKIYSYVQAQIATAAASCSSPAAAWQFFLHSTSCKS